MEQSNLPNSLQDDEQGEDTGIKAKFGQVPEELIRDLTISDGAIRFYAYLSWYCSESDDIDWRSLPFALLLYAFLKRDDQEAWWNQMRLHLKELEDNDWVAVGLDIRDDGQQVEFIQVFDNQAECKKWREAQEQERAFSIFRWMEKGPKPGFVYLLKSPGTGYWKIGRARNPFDRLKTFNVKLPFEVQYEHLIACNEVNKAEAMLHAKFAAKRVDGEWFQLDEDDLAWIKSFEKLDMINGL